MNKNAEERVQRIFADMKSSLSRTDPEFVEIISNITNNGKTIVCCAGNLKENRHKKFTK